MRNLIGLGFMVALVSAPSSAAERALVDCTVEKLHDSSFLEESLSVEEYPEVSIEEDETASKTVWLGASLYQEDDGDKVTPEPQVGMRRQFLIEPDHGYEQYRILVSRSANGSTGTLSGRNRSELDEKFSGWTLIADLKCN